MDKSKNIDIVSDFEWMRPYIKKVSHLIPKNKRITKIYKAELNPNQVAHWSGLCSTIDFRNYSIGLRPGSWYITKWNRYQRKRESTKFTKVSILQNLAHEIAHVTHWDHTPERQILENRILTIFMKELLKEGYKSEEHEVREDGGDVARVLGFDN